MPSAFVAATASLPLNSRPNSTGATSLWSYVAWGLAGFLLGAVLWHFVGFWDFLGGVVYQRQQEPAAIERAFASRFADGATAVPFAGPELSAGASARNCTTLTQDRATGRTVAHPCLVIIRNVPGEMDAAASDRMMQTAARLDRVAAGR